MPKTIGIVGSRRRDSDKDFQTCLKTFFRFYEKGDSIVSGGCEEGGDNFAERIAKAYGISITIHYPRQEDLDKKLETKNPKAAHTKINFARNAFIARDCDILIALVAEDRTGGTEDTIKHAEKLGKETVLA